MSLVLCKLGRVIRGQLWEESGLGEVTGVVRGVAWSRGRDGVSGGACFASVKVSSLDKKIYPNQNIIKSKFKCQFNCGKI